jgi:hypothetical protein
MALRKRTQSAQQLRWWCALVKLHALALQVPMWVNGQSRGEWSFMSFCSKPGFITDDSCNQPITRNTQVLPCSAAIVMPNA